MPMPLSATASSTQSRPSATWRTRSATSPSFVNLQALLKRLSRICLSRMESAVSAPKFSCASTTRRFWFFSASCLAVPMTSSISRVKFTGSGLSSSLPASIFERSSTSLIRLRRWLPAAFTRRSGSSAFSVPKRAALATISQADDGVERRAQLVAHAGKELGLALARLRQLAALVLDFVKQPHIFYRNRRLVGESLDQRDLLVGERLEFQSVDGDGSNQVVPFQHRDGERRPNRPLISHSIGILGIDLDVRDVYRPPLEGSARRDAVPSRSDRVLIYELPELRRHVVGRR